MNIRRFLFNAGSYLTLVPVKRWVGNPYTEKIDTQACNRENTVNFLGLYFLEELVFWK